MLNKEHFQRAVCIYASSMGFTKADGTPKSVSKITEDALEASIISYLISAGLLTSAQNSARKETNA
jgi:ABC-type transporter Mla maintaining outer membrane lipid asymmetry permease subunit MlaE